MRLRLLPLARPGGCRRRRCWPTLGCCWPGSWSMSSGSRWRACGHARLQHVGGDQHLADDWQHHRACPGQGPELGQEAACRQGRATGPAGGIGAGGALAAPPVRRPLDPWRPAAVPLTAGLPGAATDSADRGRGAGLADHSLGRGRSQNRNRLRCSSSRSRSPAGSGTGGARCFGGLGTQGAGQPFEVGHGHGERRVAAAAER